MPTPVAGRGVDCRTFMGVCPALGLGGALPAALWTASRSGRAAAQISQTPQTPQTGHPAVVLPNGFNPDGTPVGLAFLGRLFGEAEMLAVAEAYQGATEFPTRRPPKLA